MVGMRLYLELGSNQLYDNREKNYDNNYRYSTPDKLLQPHNAWIIEANQRTKTDRIQYSLKTMQTKVLKAGLEADAMRQREKSHTTIKM